MRPRKIILSAILGFQIISFSGEYEIIKNKMEKVKKKYEVELQDTTASMINANTILYKEWDKNLNDIYKKLLAELEKNKYTKSKNSLIESQKAWIPFRDNYSSFIYYVDSGDGKGTIRSITSLIALRTETEKRTLELAKIYDILVNDKKFEIKYTNANKSLYENYDKKLNEAYKKLMYILEKGEYKNSRKKLTLTQKSWINYRDKEANFREFLETEDGKLNKNKTSYYNFLVIFTEEWTEDINRYNKWLEEFLEIELKEM